jgi:hypothetical protein
MIAQSGKLAKAFFVLTAVLMPVLLAGAERAKNIPGIDPLPVAAGDSTPSAPGPTKSDDQQPSGENQANNPQMNPADPGYPKIRNLTVVPEPGEPYSAKISWDLYPDASTPIYVVRYSKPITNRALLLEAYNLTSPPLAPGTTVFLNRDMPEGVYYYAVVTAFELSRDGRLELRPGQNYTVTPFIVYRQDGTKPDDKAKPVATQANRDPTLKPEDFYVRDLNALDTVKGVVLNWTALPIRGIEYEIFRSTDPLDSAERLDRAVKLGKVLENTPFFTDQNAVQGRRMYYGVAVRDTITGKVFRDLKYQESYIDHTYRRPNVEIRYDAFLPESLTAFLTSGDTVQLIWIDPGPAVKEYRVYRHTMPIQTAEILASAVELGTASPGSGGFRDSGLSPGTYYYALLPVTTSGELLSVFQPGRTFTMFGISLRAPRSDKKEPSSEALPITKPDQSQADGGIRSAISGFEISSEGDDVRLSWTVVPGSAATRIQVYRSKEPLSEITALQSKAVLLGDVSVTDAQYIDHNPGAGDHYYSLAEYDPEAKTYIALYYSKRPLTIGTAGKEEDAAARLDKILSGAFARQSYAEAEGQLEAYLAQKDLLPALRSKALFYLGIVKFRLQKYREARDIFRDPAAQRHDTDRALFWYRISLERMKE